MNLLTREEAKERLQLDTSATWPRLRNYEIEDRLSHRFGGVWIITEWCPLNGVYCRYMSVASIRDLKSAIEAHDLVRVNHGFIGYISSITDMLRREIEKRGDRDEAALYPEGLGST
jgi:hypothetical protein